MPWPTPQDYNEAIQNPQVNFADAELREGVLEVTPMGLPRVASGAFASVYRMQTARRSVAVRCFLQNITDLHRRYEAISRFVCRDELNETVDFDYIDKGIRVSGSWYPVLKMEWAPGASLDVFVREHLGDVEALRKLLHNFKDMMRDMRRDGIAHGDLQHGNILVMDDCSIRLVDYDGMFVPELAGLECHELGHRNYQHPKRTKDHYGPYLDNFAAWSIFTSLFALKRDPELLTKLKGGDECLLFRTFDYKNPTKSKVFGTLEEHADEDIRNMARAFRSLIYREPHDVPFLEDEFRVPDDLPVLRIRSRAGTASGALPSWMIEDEDQVDFGVDGVDVRDFDGYADAKPVMASESDVWPSLSQYITAVSMPAGAFFDEELQLARVPRGVAGRIVPEKHGENAVFRMHKGAKVLAVKVFLHPDPDRDTRYKAFQRFLGSQEAYDADLLKYIPRFDYLPKGIRIGTKIYPVLKMEWIEGRSLLELCSEQTSEAMMDSARFQFRNLLNAMRKAKLVHGEFEPENIIMSPEGLKLIDFDAVMRWPRYQQPKIPHAVSRSKLRHPSETAHSQVGTNADVFPSWLMDSALVCLREQPLLRFSVQQGQFMFETADFDQDRDSEMLETLASSTDEIVRNRAKLIRIFANLPVDDIPPLNPEAGLERVFADLHGLKFGELRPGIVSPDVRTGRKQTMPIAIDQVSSSLTRSTSSSNLPAPQDDLVRGLKVAGVRVTLVVMTFAGFLVQAWPLCFVLIIMMFFADAFVGSPED